MEMDLSSRAIARMLYLNASCLKDDINLMGGLLATSKTGFNDSYIGKTCVAIESLWNQVKDNNTFKNDIGDENYEDVRKIVQSAIDMLNKES